LLKALAFGAQRREDYVAPTLEDQRNPG